MAADPSAPPQNPSADVLPVPAGSASLAALLAQAEASFQAARAGSTLRAYEHDWKEFRAWCDRHQLQPLPATPEAVILYATDLTKNEKRKWNTLCRRLAAISQMHQQIGFPSPTEAWPLKQFLAGLRREIGVAPVRKKPVLVEDLKQIVGQIPNTLLGKRDRALLLVGFAGGFRRSELVALDCADLEDTKDGLILTVRRSKTDQEGQGRRVGIPQGTEQASCPIWALESWLTAAGIRSGPVFRMVTRHKKVREKRLSAGAVALIIKRHVETLGFDPGAFAGHSLRAGLATSAAAAGKSERCIMNQTGHWSVTTVRRYIREGHLFRENAADGIGL